MYVKSIMQHLDNKFFILITNKKETLLYSSCRSLHLFFPLFLQRYFYLHGSTKNKNKNNKRNYTLTFMLYTTIYTPLNIHPDKGKK